MAFEQLIYELKHLAGQHNQLDHGKRGGAGGGKARSDMKRTINLVTALDRKGNLKRFSDTALQHALGVQQDLLKGYSGPDSAPRSKATIEGKKRVQGRISAIEAELKRRQPTKSEDTTPKLPKDLSKMTKRQQRETIDYLAKMPLKELRRRQDINEQQTRTAYETKNTQGLTNLQHMSRLLTAAIDKREFGGR